MEVVRVVFANRFKGLRAEKGYTQKDVADLLGISPTAVASWEQERNNPNLDTLVQIAKLFDVSVDYLLGLTDIRQPAEKYFYSGGELKQRGFIGAEELDDADYIKFSKKMKAENITPKMLEEIVPLLVELKKRLQN